MAELIEGRDGAPRAYPLSYSQLPNWRVQQANPETAAMNEAILLRIRPGLDVIRFTQALEQLVERHLMLRMRFALVGETPLQWVTDARVAPPEVIDANGWDFSAVEADVRRALHIPFDLVKGPNFRARLLQVGPSESVLLLVAHHLLLDGISCWIIIDELFELYSSDRASGNGNGIPKGRAEYHQYVHWQRTLLAGPEGRRQRTYWRRHLQGAPPVVSLPGREGASINDDAGGVFPFEIDPRVGGGLRKLAEREGITMFTVLLAGFLALLHEYSNSNDILVGSPTNDRLSLGPAYQELVGDCSNRILVRSQRRKEDDFLCLLRRTQVTVEDALRHHNYPISLAIEDVAVEDDRIRPSIGDVGFNMLPLKSGLSEPGELAPQMTRGEVTIEFLLPPRQTSRRTLVLEALDDHVRVGGLMVYRTSVFTQEEIEHLTHRYLALLWGVAEDPAQPLERLARLS